MSTSHKSLNRSVVCPGDDILYEEDPGVVPLRPGGLVLVPPGRPVRDQLSEHDQHQAEHHQPDQDQAPPEDREAQRVGPGRAGLQG